MQNNISTLRLRLPTLNLLLGEYAAEAGSPPVHPVPEAKMAFPATTMEATVLQPPGQIRHAYQPSLTYTVCVSLQKNLKI